MRCARSAANASNSSAPPAMLQGSGSSHCRKWQNAIVPAASIHGSARWRMRASELESETKRFSTQRSAPKNSNHEEITMNQHAMTIRGKDRYKSGVMEYKKMGYWAP